MTAREEILSRIGGPREQEGHESTWSFLEIGADPIQHFKTRLAALGAKVMSLDEAQARCPQPAFVDHDIVSIWGQTSTADDIWNAAAGVTSTICAVAHSGTLLLSAGVGRRRMASLAPPVHIALVSHIILTLDQALVLAPRDTSVLVTGPSRTADIEGVLVNGVHGPGELWVVLMEDLHADNAASGS